ncbi:Conserved_hypothetical protein [Hexamita inflata]|uniref:Uncharacterized protein n=1 Tax=Hexamita inflata TaxID=28002 RepID=A0AA86Q828_9EUKA|nr:Conserved hypothetical protein [Hexamita inflata]
MPEIPNINSVLETFMYYWYENAMLDANKLQLLMAQGAKITCQTTQNSSGQSSMTAHNDVLSMINMVLIKGVQNAEIAMWTPQILSDGYSLVVMVNWKDKDGKVLLMSNDTFYMQRVLASSQQRGLCIKSITTHIVYYTSQE